MACAQLTYPQSLGDIELNLRVPSERLCHMGWRCKTVSRNTMSNANATSPKQFYAISPQKEGWNCIIKNENHFL